MSQWLDVVLLITLVLINGAFALSEIALVTSRRARLQVMQEEGRKGALTAQELNRDPNRALSTIQVGITSIGILSGIVGESALARPVGNWLISLGVSPETASGVGIAIVVITVTYVSIVLGELVPKRLAQQSPETLACRVAPPLSFLSKVAAPFVALLSLSTNLILRLLKADKGNGQSVTEEEIHALMDEGEESGIIEKAERNMVRNIFRLDDRQVGSLMVPRSDIDWIDLEDSREVNVEKIRSSARSRLPVCVGSLDDVRGICSTRTLLQQILAGGKPNFHRGLLPAGYVPESLSGMELLEHFRQTDTPLALVVDEYGEVMGLVTPRDVLEAIAGEFKTEVAEDAWVQQRDDGSWLLDGLIPVPELKDTLEIKAVPEEEEGRYNTLAGMMMLLLGRLPKEGDSVEWDHWKLEIVDMDNRQIDKVIATKLDDQTDKNQEE